MLADSGKSSNESLDSDSESTLKKSGFVTREPIYIFSRIKNTKDEEEKKKLNQLLETLRKKLPEGFKIGAAVGAGDSFFDSVAQGLNELSSKEKKGLKVSVKSLRESCKKYAQDSYMAGDKSWLSNTLKEHKEDFKEYISCIEFTAESISEIKALELEGAGAKQGRLDVEGQIISKMYKKHKISIVVVELDNKQTDESKNKVGDVGNVIYVLEYQGHFVPLLSIIKEDIEESVPVSKEEVYGNTANLNKKTYTSSKSKKQPEKKESKRNVGKAQKSTTEKEKEGDKFKEILNKSNELMFKAINQDSDFELLDPLISDTQCHMHSSLILDILSGCYNKDGSAHYDVNRLNEKDKQLLSYAALFSLLRYKEKDEFGFVAYNSLIKNFQGGLLGKNKERRCIDKAKEEFNSCSVDHIKNFADGKIKEVLDECNAVLKCSDIKLKLLPCYIGMYLTIKHLENKNLPIVISLIRIVRGEDDQLCLNSREVLFYQFDAGKGEFYYREEKKLSEDEKKQLTLVFSCFSLIGKKCPDAYEEYSDVEQTPSQKFLTTGCDIRDLLMVPAAGHIQLSKNAQFSKKKETINEEHVEEFYKKHSDTTVELQDSFKGNYHLVEKNVFGCYELHRKLAKNLGIFNARYSEHEPKGGGQLIKRKNENALFVIDHVNLSNYSNECKCLKGLKVGTTVNQVSFLALDIEKATAEVTEKLGIKEICDRFDKVRVSHVQSRSIIA